jgi:hypothetical protein
MRWKDTIMDMRAVERETNAEHDSAGVEALVQSGFSEQEIPVLLRLRQGYQNGGSDRVDVVRHLEFLKFLVMHGKLQS